MPCNNNSPLIARPLRIHSPAGSPQPSINQAQHNRGRGANHHPFRPGDARETNHRLSGAADSRTEEGEKEDDNYRKPLLAFLH